MSKSIVTPVGRLVQGDLFKPETTDMDNNPLLIKTGANIGQPRVNYFMAIAIPKTDPDWPKLEAEIYAEAATGFPNYFPAGGKGILPTFAFKIDDGDSQIPNVKGKRNCDKEGFPGHWILRFSSGFHSNVFAQDLIQIVDPKAIKRGDYIRIGGTVACNGNATKPGVYMNHNMVQFIGHGQEIITGPAPEDVFGTAPVALPPGASATPLASAPMPQVAVVPPAVAAVQAAPVLPAPLPSSQPDYSILVPPAPAPAPVVAVAVQYELNGALWTETELLAAGWAHEAIIVLPVA